MLREICVSFCRFNETFDGVVLAYEPREPSNLAKILPGIHPYLGVKLKAKLLLFHPKPNMLIGSLLLMLCSALLSAQVHVIVFLRKFELIKSIVRSFSCEVRIENSSFNLYSADALHILLHY